MSNTEALVEDALRRIREAISDGKPTVTLFRCNGEALQEEIAVLREQLEVAIDRSQSWKNLAEKYKELAEARGEALDLQRARK